MLQILIISIHHAHPILVIIFPPDLKKKKKIHYTEITKKQKQEKRNFFGKTKKNVSLFDCL